jgi:hypothetical protein
MSMPHIMASVWIQKRNDGARQPWEDGSVSTEPRMISLGFGKFVRADRIFALEPLLGDARGDGRRTRVWVEGILEPIIASRTEVTILRDMGQDAAADAPLLEEAVDLAARLAAAAEAGRVDLSDLGRRARRLLAATTTNQQLPLQP